jgi:hypothetical protein
MKSIRLLAGILLLITGILHVVLYIKDPNLSGSIGLLIFGIIYTVIGILLFNRKIYPLYLLKPLANLLNSSLRQQPFLRPPDGGILHNQTQDKDPCFSEVMSELPEIYPFYRGPIPLYRAYNRYRESFREPC